MKYEYQQEKKRFVDRRPLSEPTTDLLLVTSILLSVLVHALFLVSSTNVRVGIVSEVEETIGKMFNVSFREISQTTTVARKTPEELEQEREQKLQDDLEAAEDVPAPEIDERLEDLLANAGEPVEADVETGEIPHGFSAGGAIGPAKVITSEAGIRETGNPSEGALQDAVLEDVTIERPRLGASGTYRQERIIKTLPPDLVEATPEPPSTVVTAPSLGLPSPDVSMNAAPVDIEAPPPVYEDRPLDLSAVPPSVLASEEEAKEAIAGKFVRLDDVLDVEIITYHESPNVGYFLLRIRPNQATDRLRPLPKDVVFVLDASASMGRRTLQVIKETLKDSIRRLKENQDRFNVVGFKGDVKILYDELKIVTPLTIADAWDFIDPLQASGKTDIYKSLEPLMTLGTARARPFLIFLYSDGRPTIGVRNSRAIINRLTARRGPSTSVFAIGAGDKVNEYLLDFLAFRNRGSICLIPSRDDIPQRGISFFLLHQNPVLLQVTTDIGMIDRSKIYPQELPDLYQDTELEIWGRFSDEKQLTVRLKGEAYDEQKEMVASLDIPEQDLGGPDIARGWAFHKIYHLISLVVQHGERADLVSEINALSRKYDIVTPYHEQFTE